MQLATLDQAAKVITLIAQKKIPTQQLQELLTTGLLADLLDSNVGSVNRYAFRRVLGLKSLIPEPVITELPGIVLPDQSVTFGDRIAQGGYDWKDSNITEKRFPLTLPAGPRQLVLAHFNKLMTSRDVEEWAAANGFEVAFIDDLFAIGSHSDEYRTMQLQFPILALGSCVVLDGCRRVPFISKDGCKRCLHLGWDGGRTTVVFSLFVSGPWLSDLFRVTAPVTNYGLCRSFFLSHFSFFLFSRATIILLVWLPLQRNWF